MGAAPPNRQKNNFRRVFPRLNALAILMIHPNYFATPEGGNFMGANPQKTEALHYETSKVSWATASFIRTPPPLLARVALYFGASAFVAFLVFSYFYRVPDAVDGSGNLHYGTAAIAVRSASAANVTAISVHTSQYVDLGAALFETDAGTIRSPSKGWVSGIYVGQTQRIEKGVRLAEVIPNSSSLRAIVSVPSFVASRVKPGMRARVWSDAGTAGGRAAEGLEGVVASIPFSAPYAPTTSATEHRDPVVIVAIDARSPAARTPLPEEGGAVRASIVIGKRSLARVIGDRLFNRLSETE